MVKYEIAVKTESLVIAITGRESELIVSFENR